MITAHTRDGATVRRMKSRLWRTAPGRIWATDGTGHGKGSGRMSFGARLARRETVGWRDRAKPVLNAILLVFDQF
ncbi:hypothetical protein BA763_08220 [Burkholderia cenocepacia]|nr:hypothetical protein BA763_08220 [Burkholderia cenocepacia]